MARIHEVTADTYPKRGQSRRKRQSPQLDVHIAPERVRKERCAPSTVQLPANIAAALIEIYSLSEEILACGRIGDETADDLRFLVPIVEAWMDGVKAQ